MSRALWEQLKTKQTAFLRARLVSAQAEREFRERLPEGWKALLATPFGQLTDPAALNRALDVALAGPAAARAVRPAASALLQSLLDTARADTSLAGDLLPRGAQPKLERLVSRPKIIPEKLLRQVLENDAMDEVMTDVLSAMLRDFSLRVNPLVAEWGLPSLLKKISLFGLGKGLETVRAEFERRLDPEIHSFLRASSRKALRETADALIHRADQPKHIALRRHLAAWTLKQRLSELLAPLDTEGAALLQEIALDTLEHGFSRQDLAERRREAVTAFYIEHRTRPVGEVLDRHNITLEPDFDALAGALWPLLRAACESAPVQAWLETMVAEFFDALPDDLS
ncbi:hypothetical protein [Chondromyces apiculatus]|uniref:Uncharacterized protein n=1 Tax=Chondromyces apiculatus DSM 436 TaxID=1192034 RepID=A0A017T178_9BACT|nr:hypothetical protein [Chondromyces apiculatus]EYF02321.1 Hypothetical protein CAP_7250 [Chondromyces apiculatus DSM 436]